MDAQHRMSGALPLRPMGEPKDYAGVVAFLASDDACFNHGSGLLGRRRHDHDLRKETP